MKREAEEREEVPEETEIPNKRVKFRNFDNATRRLSDVVLVVEGKKFHVIKKSLASHSEHFESLFFDNSKAAQAEYSLDGVKASDFQNLLDLIHGIRVLNDETIDGILAVANCYTMDIPISRCGEFLVESSKKPLREKFDIAVQNDFQDLIDKCLKEIKSVAELHAILSSNVEKLDAKTTKKCMQKFVDLPQLPDFSHPPPPIFNNVSTFAHGTQTDCPLQTRRSPPASH